MAIGSISYTLCSCNVACPCDLSGTKVAMDAEHKQGEVGVSTWGLQPHSLTMAVACVGTLSRSYVAPQPNERSS